MFKLRLRLNQSAPREASHELCRSEIPGLTMIGVPHTISESAEFVRSDFHDVADFMAEPHAGNVAILRWCEHGAEKKDDAIGISMMRPDHLCDKVTRVPADPGE